LGPGHHVIVERVLEIALGGAVAVQAADVGVVVAEQQFGIAVTWQ
jgi:hypothetical protein